MPLLGRGWSQSPGEGEVIASVKTKISSSAATRKNCPTLQMRTQTAATIQRPGEMQFSRNYIND